MDKGTDYKNMLVILDITNQTWKNIYVQWHILRIEKACIIITKFIPYTKQFKQYLRNNVIQIECPYQNESIEYITFKAI